MRYFFLMLLACCTHIHIRIQSDNGSNCTVSVTTTEMPEIDPSIDVPGDSAAAPSISVSR